MDHMADVQEGSAPPQTSEDIDRLRLRYGFWIIITGFALVFLITLIATFRWVEVTSVATVVGAVASLVGTVVGAFFGVQVGAVGKERAEAERERSERCGRAKRADEPLGAEACADPGLVGRNRASLGRSDLLSRRLCCWSRCPG
jgi:hypothetical protein